MRFRRLLSALTVVVALQLWATSVIPMSVEQLTAAASNVVRARAISSEARWNEDRTIIYTFTRFASIETWKGAPASEFIVRQMGGRVGNVEQKVSGVRRWNAGDEAILFLRPSEAGNGVMAVVGLFQGNFSLHADGGKLIASNGVPDALQLNSATQQLEHFKAASYTLSELHQRVVRALGQ